MDAVTTAATAATSADDALVRRARTGDAAAFEVLVETRVDRCYRLAWSILSNAADAADATQEALVSAWRELPRLRDISAFDGWLNRIVANSARMARRRRVRLREVQVRETGIVGLEVEARDDRPDPAAHVEIDRVADSDAIGRAFDRLRPEERVILVLHHVEERPVGRSPVRSGSRSARPSGGCMPPDARSRRRWRPRHDRPTPDGRQISRRFARICR